MDLKLMLTIFIGVSIFAKDNAESDECGESKCSIGEHCIDERCVCRDTCHQGWKLHYRKICVDGVTYSHVCDLSRNICYCRQNDARCGDETNFGGHRAGSDSVIRYYDECRDLSRHCKWFAVGKYFRLQLIRWFKVRLSEKLASSTYNKNVLLRPIDSKHRLSIESLSTRNIRNNGSGSGALMSYWFCVFDTDNSGEIDDSEFSHLTQVALPSIVCLETFFTGCVIGRHISRDNWLDCFQVEESDRRDCKDFL